MYSSTISLTSALDKSGVFNAKLLPLNPKNIRFALYGRLGGPQKLSGRAWKISPQPEFHPRSFQDLATRYADPQPYERIGTEKNLAVLTGFLAHLFERNRIREHRVMSNNP
jgi:hypothetical protein